MLHSKNLLVLAEVESWLRLFVLRLQGTSQRLDISSTVLVSSKGIKLRVESFPSICDHVYDLRLYVAVHMALMACGQVDRN